MKSWWSYPTIVLLLMVHCTAVLVHAGSIFCDDSELCLSKRFLRFGRALRDDPYYRISRQFYRLGRGYQPYQDKRFLRFGRSQQLGANDVYDDGLLQLEEPYSRKRRSLDTDSQSQFTHDHVKRSADQSEHEQIANDETSKAIRKRAIDDDMNSGDEVEKRFMRFGRDFSRNNNEVDKRFMRFGKRFVPVKKFMRFGRNNRFGNDFLATASKRFMRFGKRQDDGDEKDGLVGLDEDQMHKVNGILTLANQLSSESEQKNGLYGMDKRFMRFGKREAKTVDMQRVS